MALDCHAERPARRVTGNDRVSQMPEATCGPSGLLGRLDRDDPAAAAVRELHGAGAGGEDRVVAAEAHALAGLEAGSALAHDDLAARDLLAREHLDAEALGVRVAAVAAGAEALLMSHPRPPSLRKH